MTAFQEQFAERLKVLREERGWTQAELAHEINSTKVQISRYETGVIFPVFETIIKMALVFDVSLDYLAGRTDNRLVGDTSQLSDLTHDEQRLINCLRRRDIETGLIALSFCVRTSPERARQRFEASKDVARMFRKKDAPPAPEPEDVDVSHDEPNTSR